MAEHVIFFLLCEVFTIHNKVLVIFQRFPTTFRRFPKIFQIGPKARLMFLNIFQRLPKMTEE